MERISHGNCQWCFMNKYQLFSPRYPLWFSLLATLLSGCGGGQPFEHVPIAGQVTYEDGSVIPVAYMELTFQPLANPVDEKTHPRPGHAGVDVTSGEFHNASTHSAGDGVVAGRHKVKITAHDQSQQVSAAIPSEYMDTTTTPLEYDTSDRFWEIKIKRPAQ